MRTDLDPLRAAEGGCATIYLANQQSRGAITFASCATVSHAKILIHFSTARYYLLAVYFAGNVFLDGRDTLEKFMPARLSLGAVIIALIRAVGSDRGTPSGYRNDRAAREKNSPS